MPSCSVFGCSMRTNTNQLSKVRCFSFPKDEERRNAWRCSLNRKNWVPTSNSRVCSRHFQTGAPVNDPNHPDWKPNILPHLTSNIPKSVQKMQRKMKLDHVQEKNLSHTSQSNEKSMDLSVKNHNPVKANFTLAKMLEMPSPDTLSLPTLDNRKRKWIETQQHGSRFDSSYLFQNRHRRPGSFHEPFSESYSPDVIVLTDEEDMPFNGHVNGTEHSSRSGTPESDMTLPVSPELKELTEEECHKREKETLRLKQILRDEEMKLVLLKKLHQSQIIKENVIGTAINSPKLATGKSIADTSLINSPLMRSQLSSCLNSRTLWQRPVMSALLHDPTIPGTMSALAHSKSRLPVKAIIQQMRSGQGPRSPVNSLNYRLQSLHSGSNVSVSVSQVPTPVSPVPHLSVQSERADNQTPAQRQAAAKLALRKQLEKTLLQIPPPKPPPPELHFVPNANSPDFIYLLGLEVVVSFFTGDSIYNKSPPDPFECVQCSTNFTSVWKWQETSTVSTKPSVICESCVTSNIKKALKAEHTNRLKTAFVKALQQEQEIEQRMSQGISNSPPPYASSPPLHVVNSNASSIIAPTSPVNHISTTISKIATTATAVVQQLPKLTTAQQSMLQTQQLQQVNQNQPQPAHMLSFAPILASQAYSYQMMGKSFNSSDLQRQYLLDMIPPRSLSQSAMNWKT